MKSLELTDWVMKALTPAQLLERYFDERSGDVDIPESLRELKGSATELSEEEKERRRKEVEEMSSKELSKAFGLE